MFTTYIDKLMANQEIENNFLMKDFKQHWIIDEIKLISHCHQIDRFISLK
jgi:hypothetical protein